MQDRLDVPLGGGWALFGPEWAAIWRNSADQDGHSCFAVAVMPASNSPPPGPNLAGYRRWFGAVSGDGFRDMPLVPTGDIVPG
jgi:hypothetical protein